MRVLYSMLLWHDLCVDVIVELVPFGSDGAAQPHELHSEDDVTKIAAL